MLSISLVLVMVVLAWLQTLISKYLIVFFFFFKLIYLFNFASKY